MNSFRELLEVDDYELVRNEEFIRFHGKEWFDQHKVGIMYIGSFQYGLHEGTLKVFVDVEFVLDILTDIGFVIQPHVPNQGTVRGLIVKTNGKKWASETDIHTGKHVGFYGVGVLVQFLAPICGPAWVNHKDSDGTHMGFHYNKKSIRLLASVGGQEFVDCKNKNGEHIGFICNAEDIPFLAEIGGPEWVNHKNNDGFRCRDLRP